jgi:NAD(P)-dependent dehydrogenase (short-subunit alcohol dehydrogenase family)
MEYVRRLTYSAALPVLVPIESMASQHHTVVIINANSRYGRWSVQRLAPTARKIVAVVPQGAAADPTLQAFANMELAPVDLTDEASWQSLCARLTDAGEDVDVLIHAAPERAASMAVEAATNTNILAPWLATKYAYQLMHKRGRGIVVLQAARSGATSADRPLCDGEWQAMRIGTAAVVLDAAKQGVRLRLNRLMFDADVGEAHFAAALGALTDERSSFMTGAELVLSAGGETRAVREDLAGKTVLVTGATSGIGRATAIELGRLGAFVAVGGRKLPLAEETLSQVRAAGGDGMVVSLDVTSEAHWQAAIANIVAARGALHGLVSNAGESRHRHISELTTEDLNFLLAVNYRACVLGMTHASAAMRESGGSIVNVTSVAGLRAGPGNAAYGTSKAGAIGLTLGFANALNREGAKVRINALQPGFIWSESVEQSLGREGAAAFRAMIEPKTPLGRVGQVDEVARMAGFLLSDAAAPINGQLVTVSGGLELSFP